MTTETKIDTGTDELLCVIRDRVAIITLNRPEARNSLSDNLTPALRNMIKACGENPDVGVLLLTGAGTVKKDAVTKATAPAAATRTLNMAFPCGSASGPSLGPWRRGINLTRLRQLCRNSPCSRA